MLTAQKQYFSFLPPAGVSEQEIEACSRFGLRLNESLKADKEKENTPMLRNLGAAVVNGKLIATEKIASRSFQVWTKLIKAWWKKIFTW